MYLNWKTMTENKTTILKTNAITIDKRICRHMRNFTSRLSRFSCLGDITKGKAITSHSVIALWSLARPRPVSSVCLCQTGVWWRRGGSYLWLNWTPAGGAPASAASASTALRGKRSTSPPDTTSYTVAVRIPGLFLQEEHKNIFNSLTGIAKSYHRIKKTQIKL